MFGLIALLALAGMVVYSQLASLLMAIFIPVLLLGTVLHERWMVSRFLDHPWMRAIGRISYGLYVWQAIFLVPGWTHASALQRPPWNLALAALVAAASYLVLEKPCMAIGHRLSERLRERREPFRWKDVSLPAAGLRND